MKKYLIRGFFGLFVILQVLVLTSCGGGGSSGSGGNSGGSSSLSSTPTVSMTSPNPTTNVLTSTNIELQFNVAVTNVNTSTVTLFKGSESSGTQITINFIESAQDNSYIFKPQTNLSPLAQYTVVVSNKITSVTGQALTKTTFTFSTSSIPTVSITPQDNTKNVSFKPSIQLKFSEAVQNVNASTVSLHESNGAVVPIGNISAGTNNSYSFEPSGLLNNNTTYYVEVTNGITSMATNEPLAANTSSFTTRLNHYAYVTSYIESTVSVCTVNESDGGLSNCKPTGSSFVHTYGIAVDPTGSYAYVANAGSTISVCSIESSTGKFNSCTAHAKESSIPYAYGVAIDPSGNNLYVATLQISRVTKCTISKFDGKLKTCTAMPNLAGSNTLTPYALAINPNGQYAYITTNSNASVLTCSIAEDGTFTNCNNFASKTMFPQPTGVAVDPTGQNIYFVNTGTTTAQSCKVPGSDGNFTGLCTSSEGAFANASGLALDLAGNYAYVANNSLNTVSVCPIVNAIISNCTTSNGNGIISSPEFVAVY